MRRISKKTFILWLILTTFAYNATSQPIVSSPSTWLLPNGNLQGTRYQPIPSFQQNINQFIVKWRNKSIAGDVQILVGNVIKDTAKIDDTFPYGPNEIVAAVGGKIVVVDGKGFTHKTNTFGFQYVKNVSALFDTLSTSFYPNPTSTVVIGLETIEFENQKDTLIYSYIAGYDAKSDTIALLKRLVLDMRTYKPNVFGSIKPFFGKRYGNNYLFYALSNIIKPEASQQNPQTPPFYRGFSVFPSNNIVYTFPLPDITDNSYFRVTLGPEVSFATPSIYQDGGNFYACIPNYASLEPDVNVPCNISLDKTNPTKSYLLAYSLINDQIRQKFQPLELNSILDGNGKRPRIRPFFLTLNNSATSDSVYILVAEEYLGIDSSYGQSRLHLFDANGNAITIPNDIFSPSFSGMKNHLWSIAIGNVDGASSNNFSPYYPNNPGKEIIATFSSKFSSVANNRILVLRYNAGNPVPKPNPPNSFLFPFDTIVTFPISGWVAAVNDLDNAPDGKDEIILVDGSRLLILRLRDYSSFEFRLGKPFDTLFIKEFPNETIMDAIVADIEGDGKNDIVVVTNNYLYLIGSPLPKLIEVLNPKYDETTIKDYCYGDTLSIILKSKSKSEESINVRFVPRALNQNDMQNSIILSKGITIDRETTLVKIPVVASLLGKTGILYIENSLDTTQVFDSTGVFSFNPPEFIVDTVLLKQVDYYDKATLGFTVNCVDTLWLQYSFDGKTWTDALRIVSPQQTEIHSIALPCAPIFNYYAQNVQAYVTMRAIIARLGLRDTSGIFYKSVKPNNFPLTFDSSSTLCCSKYFRWGSLPNCDTITVLLSTDAGNTYRKIADVNPADISYTFEQQRNFPDLLAFRFVCSTGCLLADTSLFVSKPSIINTVAPNPFNPKLEQAEISYILTNDANVTIKILDQANRIVAKLLDSSPRTKETYYCVHWDGNTTDGKIVDPGLYYILIETSDGIQEIFPIFVK